MKFLTYAISVLSFFILTAIFIFCWQLRGPTLDFSCSSYFVQDNRNDEFYMNSNTLISFSLDRKGFISMDGSVTHGGVVYKFRRDYSFIYKNAGGNKWQLSDVEVVLAGSDDVPLGLIERNFYSTEKKKNGQYIYVARINDTPGAWVVGGVYTPAFMCMNNES